MKGPLRIPVPPIVLSPRDAIGYAVTLGQQHEAELRFAIYVCHGQMADLAQRELARREALS